MEKLLEKITVPQWRGIRKAAKTFGCSKTHLSLVLKGMRVPGKELAEQLKREGVKLPCVKNIVH